MSNDILPTPPDEYIQFVKRLFQVYLVQRDFDTFLSMLAPQITWVGTGTHEICHNFDDAQRLITEERDAWDGHFNILSEWYESTILSDTHAIVYGEMNIEEAGLNTILIDMHSRFTIVCQKGEDGVIRMVSGHYSVPNAGQTTGEFVHKNVVNNYNKLLEKALESRTKILKRTTRELETVIANIQGGVQICKNDDAFTNLYVNDGYYELIGYTKEEFAERFKDSHTAVIEESVRASVKDEVRRQLENGNNVTLNYPLTAKDGSLVWVLDRGTLTTDSDGVSQFQCVLVDVTAKEHAIKNIGMLNDYYESILHSIPNPLIITNEHQHITFLNHQALKLMGNCAFSDIKGKSCHQLSVEMFGYDCNAIGNLQQGNPHTNITMKGHDYLITSAPLTREGNNIGFVMMLQDETAQNVSRRMLMKKNDELLISETRYKIAMEQVNICMFEYSIQNRVLTHSESTMCKFGLPRTMSNAPESIIKTGVFPERCHKPVRDAFKHIKAGDPVVKYTISMFDIEGKETIQEITTTTIISEDNTPSRVIGILMDVTQKSQLEMEKQYRDALTADCLLTYESNLTKDIIINCKTNDEYTIIDFDSAPFSQLLYDIADKYIHPDDREDYIAFATPTNILKHFSKGETCITHEHRRRQSTDTHDFAYMLTVVNVARDANTGDVKAFCQVKDISEEKERQQRAADEQLFYEAMKSKAATIYEINITKNQVLRGHEAWYELYGIPTDISYVDMSITFAEKFVCDDDQASFISAFSIENVVEHFNRDKHEIVLEYRRLGEDNEYIWICCTMHIFEDPSTGDIKAYSYIENINSRKQKELELVYKSERDWISGFYNKGTLQSHIEQFLISKLGKQSTHAFIMFDVDNFKQINDNFGHQFGDVVLSDVSKKIKRLFRDNDILGRIGGDEFVIFMKDIASPTNAISKAQEICDAIRETYEKNGNEYRISASVGVAFYPQDGNTFQDLYNNSDIALYASKKNGKDRFSCYSKSMNQITDMVNLAARTGYIEQRSIEQNLSEYIFHILHSASDIKTAINNVLELVGKHYGFRQAYIFESTLDNQALTATYVWNDDGADTYSYIAEYRLSELGNYGTLFNNLGILVADPSEPPKAVERLLCGDDAKTTLQFMIAKNGKFMGFIGFDDCRASFPYSMADLSKIKDMADVLSLFLVSQRINESHALENNVMALMLEQINCTAYVVEGGSHIIRHASQSLVDKFPNIYSGKPCYAVLHKRDTPCEACRLDELENDSDGIRYEAYYDKFGCKYTVNMVPIRYICTDCRLVTVIEHPSTDQTT